MMIQTFTHSKAIDKFLKLQGQSLRNQIQAVLTKGMFSRITQLVYEASEVNSVGNGDKITVTLDGKYPVGFVRKTDPRHKFLYWDRK